MDSTGVKKRPYNRKAKSASRRDNTRPNTANAQVNEDDSNQQQAEGSTNSPSSSTSMVEANLEEVNNSKERAGAKRMNNGKGGKNLNQKRINQDGQQGTPNKRRKKNYTQSLHQDPISNVKAGKEPDRDEEDQHNEEQWQQHRGRGKKNSNSPPKQRTLEAEQEKEKNNLLAEETALRDQLNLAQKEKDELQAKLEEKETIMSMQRETISQMHSQCSCTICLELAFRPHVLSPCGHVFCARCLVMWFKKPQPDEQPIPLQLTAQQRQEEEDRRTIRRKKVCPHCRERVMSKPAEVWMIKGLVDTIDESVRSLPEQSKNDDADSKSPEVRLDVAEVRNETLKPGTQVWDKIFPTHDYSYQRPIYDDEDQVYRCGHCAREIVDLVCSNPYCAMEYGEEDLDDFYVHGDHSDIGDFEALYGSDASISDDDWDEDDRRFIDDGAIEIEDDSEDEVEILHRAMDAERRHSDGEVELVAINERNPGPRRNRNRRIIALSDSEDEEGPYLNNPRIYSPPNSHFSDNEDFDEAEGEGEAEYEDDEPLTEEEEDGEGTVMSEDYENYSDAVHHTDGEEGVEYGSESYDEWDL